MKLDKKQYQDVEQQFFDLDDENNIAYLWRNFESPGEILDLNAFSKIPLMNSEQREAVRSFRKRFHAIKYTGQRPDPCLERGEQKS